MPRVLIVRGHLVNPWELGPWTKLPEEFEVSYLLTGSNRFDPPAGRLAPVRARALRDLLPGGPLGELGAGLAGDRYLNSTAAFARADIVHAEELSFWFSAQAARERRRHGFRLVQTVWETLPLLATYRNRHARRFRSIVLAESDLFLPTTQRAADALALEGVEPRRIRVCQPGIDVARFAARPAVAPREHLIVSPGRLVSEKGHQDVMRALAAIKRGLGGIEPPDAARGARLLIVGSGPEEGRLRAYANELGIGPSVELRSVPYDQMPAVFGSASSVVLASVPWAGAAYHPFDVPRVFWEEQFGMVLAEAMASGVEIVASSTGAIPEVLEGTGARMVAPGDWLAIARALVDGPLARPPAARVEYPPEIIERYSLQAAAGRLAAAYEAVL